MGARGARDSHLPRLASGDPSDGEVSVSVLPEFQQRLIARSARVHIAALHGDAGEAKGSQWGQCHCSGVEIFGSQHACVVQDFLEFPPRIRAGPLLQIGQASKIRRPESRIGAQLDALGYQLVGVDQNHPKARDVRSMVGEQLPQMIESYRKIPAHLRSEKRAGSTPDEQLVDSLAKISAEIDSITRQLAEGSLDDLAIKHRYLDYKYGENSDGTAGDYGVPLPDFDKTKVT